MLSDRARKEGFEPVDRSALLERLAALEITEWSYSSDGAAVRHVGPMAQDFRGAFGLGADDQHIQAVDGQGVTIAAVQALYERLEQLRQENDALKRNQDALEKRLREVERLR
jgi:hypothetical protein